MNNFDNLIIKTIIHTDKTKLVIIIIIIMNTHKCKLTCYIAR